MSTRMMKTMYTTKDARCPSCGDRLHVDPLLAKMGSVCASDAIVKWPYYCTACGSRGDVLALAKFVVLATAEDGDSKVVYMEHEEGSE